MESNQQGAVQNSQSQGSQLMNPNQGQVSTVNPEQEFAGQQPSALGGIFGEFHENYEESSGYATSDEIVHPLDAPWLENRGQQPNNQQQPPQPVAQQPGQQNQQSMNPDQQRFEYWQSQHDVVKNQLREFEPYKPYIDLLKQNPQILDVIEQTVTSESQPNLPERPQPPEIPSTYNELEAYSDPDSASFSYRIQREKYRDSLIDYQNEMIGHMQQQNEAIREDYSSRFEQQQQVQSSRNYLINKYNMPQGIADAFIQEVQANKLMNDDNMVRLFYMNHPEYQMQQPQQMGMQQPQFRQMPPQPMQPQMQPMPQGNLVRRNVPPSVIMGNGINQTQSVDAQFMDGIGRNASNVEY